MNPRNEHVSAQTKISDIYFYQNSCNEGKENRGHRMTLFFTHCAFNVFGKNRQPLVKVTLKSCKA